LRFKNAVSFWDISRACTTVLTRQFSDMRVKKIHSFAKNTLVFFVSNKAEIYIRDCIIQSNRTVSKF